MTNIERLYQTLASADGIAVGAGAGLSTAAGYTYSGERFEKFFADFIEKLVPHCPVCGGPMSVNLRSDSTFVEDEGWHAAAQRYVDFIQNHQKGKILYWDLGIGSNTPTIIKLPFMQQTLKNPDAIYATINLGEAFTVEQIKDRSIVIDADIANVLEQLLTVNC